MSSAAIAVALACSANTHDFGASPLGDGGGDNAGTQSSGGSTSTAGKAGIAGTSTTAGGAAGGTSDCAPGATEPCNESPDGKSYGPIPTTIKGTCLIGVRTCNSLLVWGECVGAVPPLDSDTCEAGNDANCNGTPNEGCSCTNGQMRDCGSAVGGCKQGKQTCANQVWGDCAGEVKAAATDTCDTGNDANCNGTPNNGCECLNGAKRTCLSGSATGNCKKGEETCKNGAWDGVCVGAVAQQSSDKCSPVGDDANCNGSPNEGCDCKPGDSRGCGNCGTQTCGADSKWPATCSSQKECKPTDVKAGTEDCGNCGTQNIQYTCGNTCTYGVKQLVGSCVGSRDCKPGVPDQTQMLACGNCGKQTQTRSCGASCYWNQWTDSGTCSGEGACSPTTSIAAVSVSCEYCGEQKKKKVCSGSCAYGGPVNDGTCIQNHCDDLPGDERTGYVNCLHPDTTNKVCLPSEQCCLSFDGGYSCKPGGCSGTDIQAECDGPEDCTGGNRCCSQYDPNGHETEYTMCAPTCPSNTRCHNDADCAAYFPGTDNPHCSQYAGVAGNGYHNGICYSGQQNL